MGLAAAGERHHLGQPRPVNPPKTSPLEEVRELYESTADSYADMMDAEIDLPVYGEVLSRLADHIADLEGPVVDTSCGSGHMLDRYRERLDATRPLVGIDLSPRMVAIAAARLGAGAQVFAGDMREVREVEAESAAAVVSFFAIHHLDPEEVPLALAEWRRVLRPGGRLLLAAWEGAGAIDYGGESGVVALRFTRNEVRHWAEAAGYVVDRCVVEPVEEIPMDAVYLEGSRA